MYSQLIHPPQPPLSLSSTLHKVVAVCSVAVIAYFAAELGGAMVLRPQMVWPLWPGCAFLVSVLLLTSRKIWPALLVAGLTGFLVYDLSLGLPTQSIALLLVADTAEVLIAAWGASYALGGIPRLNSVKALAKYAFFALVLAPISVASLGALAIGGEYWIAWRISFLTEALALLTLTPAVLSWAEVVRQRAKKPLSHYLEATALFAGLTTFAYLTFVISGASRPALLYSLVPFLLWAALRFGTAGIGNSMVVIASFSTWGAIHGLGPFTGRAPLDNVLSLQLFSLFAAASFMVQAALVEENKHAVQELQESEARFRLVANSAPVLIWMSANDKSRTYFNKQWLGFTGHSLREEVGTGWMNGVYPNDAANSLKTYVDAFDGRKNFQMEYRLRRSDGEYRWVLDVGVPRFSPDGTFEGYIGSCIDVTERKLAEEVLSSVSRKLIRGQEQERSRIARELHDDIAQQLVLLAAELEQLQRGPADSVLQLRARIGELLARISEISFGVQAMSHELHSPKLEYLGLVAAARGFCREFGERKKVEVSFASQSLSASLPVEISLSLFRVLQEALNNASKHSGVRRFDVRLWENPGEVHLTISDLGVGFDIKTAMKSSGLGLTSMHERLKLANGELTITSQASRGTTVHARVPSAASSDTSAHSIDDGFVVMVKNHSSSL